MPFDGFKISVSDQVGKTWLECPLLSFQYVVNTSTGECMDGKRWANYNGLTFFIIKSKKYENRFYYSVKGSFHKYHNKGEHNYNDYSFNHFQETLNELETLFKLRLNETTLQRLEFGLNIEFTKKVEPIINGIRAYKNTNYTNFRVKNEIVGTHTKTEHNETKIYNKTKQFKLDKNIVRFEYVLKTKKALSLYGINSLEDLKDKNKVLRLGKILFDVWNNTIFYDNGINIKQMSVFNQKKFLRYLDAKYWLKLEKKQRLRSKQHFFNIINELSTTKTQKKVSIIIAQKWHYLTAVLCPPFPKDLENKTAFDLSTFSVLEYSPNKWTNSIKEIKQKKAQNPPQKTTEITSNNPPQKKAQFSSCSVCKKTLEHKRKNTKYCSKKCNNTLNGKKRTSKRKHNRNIEIENLQKLIPKIHLNRFDLLITYKNENSFYTDQLHQSEILTTSETIKQINKIEVTGHRKNATPIKLTTLRAKQLIRNINLQNHKIRTNEKDKTRK